jgi:nucleotide-binding universal stress UspA family protein
LTFSTLLACMRVGHSNADLLGVVADLAQHLGSAVIGVAVRQATAHANVRGAGPFAPHQHDIHRFAEDAAAAEDEFRAALSSVASIAWRAEMTLGPPCQRIAEDACAADLVVAPVDRPIHATALAGHPDIGDLLMRLGRPVLAAPQGVAHFRFEHAVVCFKNAREARRAIADSLPILRAMKRVDVVEVVEGRNADDAARRLGDVRDWLARHGVEASCATESGTGSEARHLASIVRDRKADLIVAGAFGHSRLREWAFGGVTNELLLRAECCVLASH